MEGACSPPGKSPRGTCAEPDHVTCPSGTSRSATPRHATQHHATPRNITQRHATSRDATQRHATPRDATHQREKERERERERERKRASSGVSTPPVEARWLSTMSSRWSLSVRRTMAFTPCRRGQAQLLKSPEVQLKVSKGQKAHFSVESRWPSTMSSRWSLRVRRTMAFTPCRRGKTKLFKKANRRKGQHRKTLSRWSLSVRRTMACIPCQKGQTRNFAEHVALPELDVRLRACARMPRERGTSTGGVSIILPALEKIWGG